MTNREKDIRIAELEAQVAELLEAHERDRTVLQAIAANAAFALGSD